jgi:hypothetical protein
MKIKNAEDNFYINKKCYSYNNLVIDYKEKEHKLNHMSIGSMCML